VTSQPSPVHILQHRQVRKNHFTAHVSGKKFISLEINKSGLLIRDLLKHVLL